MNAAVRQVHARLCALAKASTTPGRIASELARLAAVLIVRRPVRQVLKYAPTHRPVVAPRMTTAQIAVVVRERANGVCEACQKPFMPRDPFSLDHWLNGHGRRRQLQSVQNCWGIHKYSCHPDRQEYRIPQWAEPLGLSCASTGASFWNSIFRRHCERHDYRFVPHIEHQALRRRAG